MRVALRGVVVLMLLPGACTKPDAASETKQPVAADSNRDRFALKQTCMRAGLDRAADDRKDLPSDTRVLKSEYCYSAKFNTCLYSGEFFNKEVRTLFVIDLSTNREIASAIILMGSMSGESLADSRRRNAQETAQFQKERDAAMSTCIE